MHLIARVGAMVLILVAPGIHGRTLRAAKVETQEEEALATKKIMPPPDHAGTQMKANKEGTYDSKADACAACKYAATGSCAMYNTCRCYASNAFFPMVATPKKDAWVWACGGDDVKYKLCFGATDGFTDNFGDKIDEEKPKCPL
mmetsp:Transcript_90816/g.143485  ORF Transcript_90816/g.143485 Transcript_90816/m.143485 type:complete len:144 (+) Transcript_90816:81-512(+)